jgi:hypothetical protein
MVDGNRSTTDLDKILSYLKSSPVLFSMMKEDIGAEK